MNFRYFADCAEQLDHADRGDPRPPRADHLRPGRRRRDHHAVERAADAGHLADRSGARGRATPSCVKPPEWAPLTASLLADIAHEAGLPAGVFNVVQGTGRRGRRAADPAPRHQPALLHRLGADRRRHRRGGRAEHRAAVLRAGRQVAAAGLRRLPTSTSPSTWPSSSSTTPARSASGAFRILVHGRHRRRVPRTRASSSAPAPGPGRPARRGDRRQRAGQPGALRAGLRLRRAGASPTAPSRCSAAAPTRSSAGCSTRPTILTGAEPGSEILTEEVFGPVLTVQTFATEEEGVAMANNTRFGLAATLVTGDPERAERVSARLERRHRVGQLLLRPRPRRTLRRQREVGHRPRGRRLVLRLLLRHQEQRVQPRPAGPPNHERTDA